VECHAEAFRCGDEPGAAIAIHVAVGIQHANHHAFATKRDAGFDIALHRGALVIAVQEVTCARTDQHVQRYAKALAGEGDLAVRRGEAAEFERRAQLHATRAAVLRGDSGGH
jgi:hypothetical protein